MAKAALQPPSMTENFSNPVRALPRSMNSDAASNTVSNGSSAPDEVLLRRIAEQDQQAMALLFDRHSRLVYSVSLRVLGDTSQAEDAMQEIFFQLWKAPGSFVHGRSSLAAWLAVVARNRAVDMLRRRKPSDPVEDVVLTSSTNLASEVECAWMMDKVRVVLKDLPAEQQRMLELAFFEGLTHSEIAAQTGDPLGTVKTRIRSALMTLRKAVQA